MTPGAKASASAARTLVSHNRFGILSTQSRQHPGFPFGSLMPYAVDQQGCPLLFISTLAMHTRNLQENHQASLFISESYTANDPLAAPRVTLLGLIDQLTADDVSNLYLAQHANAKQWQDFSDFAYYRMEVTAAYFIAGFGQMGWIPSEEYRAACPTI